MKVYRPRTDWKQRFIGGPDEKSGRKRPRRTRVHFTSRAGRLEQREDQAINTRKQPQPGHPRWTLRSTQSSECEANKEGDDTTGKKGETATLLRDVAKDREERELRGTIE